LKSQEDAMNRLTAIVLALLTAAAPLSAAAPPDSLQVGQQIRLQTNPPAGAMARNGTFQMPGRSVGRNGEGITVSLEERSATFSMPGHRLEGRLLGADAETLTLRLRGWDEPVTVLRRAVSRLEVRQGGRSREANVWIGAAIGTGVGVALALASFDDESASLGLEPVALGIVGAVGLGIGALAGLATGGRTWTTVDPKANLRLSVVPTRGGVGAALTVGF
jgi:hypothetical protein